MNNNQLQVFNFKNSEVRTVMVNEEPWFLVKDVCDVLEIINRSQAVERLDSDEKLMYKLYISGQNRDVLLVNESGLYSLVLTSNKLEAKEFKRWVTHEVIPSIRKTGTYSIMLQQKQDSYLIENPAERARRWAEEYEEKQRILLEKQEAERKNNLLMHTSKNYTMTELAKELAFKSATVLNDTLHEMGVHYKMNDTWCFYSKYSGLGYDETKQEIKYYPESGRQKIIYHRRITQKGRDFILGLFNKTVEEDNYDVSI